jgi:translocation and assembly module TamB
LFVWGGPIVVVLILTVCGFLYWAVATQAGTRWALTTAVEFLDGQARGIRGALWSGVSVHELAVPLPDVVVRLDDLHLQANWRELLDQRVHVIDLSASRVRVDLKTPGQQAPAEPFSMPALPFRVAVDRLAADEVIVTQDGHPLPVGISHLATAIALTESGGQLSVQSLTLAHEQIKANIEGDFKVAELRDPWPSTAHFTIDAVGTSPDSPLCARRFVPSLPVALTTSPTITPTTAPTKNSPALPTTAPTVAPETCTLVVDASIEGSLDRMQITLDGKGQGMALDADAILTPRGPFPLQTASVALELADGSSLRGNLDWASKWVDSAWQDHVVGALRSEKLDVGRLAGSTLPSAVLSAAIDFDAQLLNHTVPLSADLAVKVDEGSRWNDKPAAGVVKAKLVNALPASARAPETRPETGAAAPPAQAAPAVQIAMWQSFQLRDVGIDLRVGKNHVQAQGALGIADSLLKLDVQAPVLADFWPDLPGGATVHGQMSGSPARHKADLTASYTPPDSRADVVGSARANAHLTVDGGWVGAQAEGGRTSRWSGSVSALKLDHAGLALDLKAPMAITLAPDARAPDWVWQVGAAPLALALNAQPVLVLDHKGSRGGDGRWETQGDIARLALSPRFVGELRKKLNLEAKQDTARGGVKVKADQGKDLAEIVLGMNWNLRFAGALEGQAHIERLSGDVMVPAEPSFPLGLTTLRLDLDATRTGPLQSRLGADLTVQTAKMGHLTAKANTLLHATAAGGIVLNPKDVKTVLVNADIEDLGWTSLFLGDEMELGGSLQAELEAQSRPDGSWNSSGVIHGKGIRFVRIDDGIRLLDGTLSARLAGDRLILDSLRFPARLRVEPKEWRTAEWVSTNPDAKDGALTLSGEWNLMEPGGHANLELYRYPILQRSDRYAMVTGKLRMDATMPKIAVSGDITADAGWFDLDVLGGVPTLDGDVVIIRAGDKRPATVSGEPGAVSKAPLDMSLDVKVDLGRRFYLTGYGVNSGLVGTLHVMMVDGKLTGVGQLRTRGGAIEAYGQRLQLRRGTITFQGDIASPLLDIEALRTGQPVEAGVRVAGTAKRPRIDLVSYPAVSEVEKLSWLLLGHGPDESGGDAALLFSVGSSFLTNGEPFYRKFGIDELSMQSGELGSAGSILPVESVVGGLDTGTSDIERRFIQASKGLSNGITLSIQQALSDTGTVGRASYRLARGLTAQLSVGTVNGLALIYRWFSRD